MAVSSMKREPTVTHSLSRAIVMAASRQGVELPEPLLGTLRTTRRRTPFVFQDQLWAAIAARSDDPLIGLKIGRDIQIGSLDSAGLLVMSSGELRDAIDVLIGYFPIISEGCSMAFDAGDAPLLRYLPSYTDERALRAEFVLAFTASMASWVTGGAVEPPLVFAHAPRADKDAYRAVLGAPPRFDAEAYGLALSDEALRTPLVQGNASLFQRLRPVADEAMSQLLPQNIGAQVRTTLLLQPSWGRKQVADALEISPRHLTRLLQEEGRTFKDLREEVLLELAKGLLADPASRLRGVAERLGFSDASAFTKAFRRWTGKSPSAFRDDDG